VRRAGALFSGLFLLLSITSNARAAGIDPDDAKKKVDASVEKKKKPWRNTRIVYENIFSAISLNKSHDQTWNPYYAQSLSLQPRYYIRDDLNLRLRLDVEVELTQADGTDLNHEPLLSDLMLDANYAPKWLTIPKVDVRVNPSIRFAFPTSIVSRGRSLVMSIGPGVAFKRSFTLLKGKWLKQVLLTYAFRPTLYLHEYAEASVEARTGCENINRPECQHRGSRNRAWRLTNTLMAQVQITDKWSAGIMLFLMNDILHELDGGTERIQIEPQSNAGSSSTHEVPTPSSEINHRGAVWAILDVSYDVLDWLSLSVGTSTYYYHLAPDSDYEYFFFNRNTNFYFDVMIPIDRFVDQVQKWRGKS
jgi:hypothetical protein